MKKILIIIYVIFSVLSLFLEIKLNFREIKKSIYSLNFEKNYISEKLYVEHIIFSTEDSSYGKAIISGKIINDNEQRTITLSKLSSEKYCKLDKKNKMFYDIWYNKETSSIFLKKTTTGFIYYNGFLLMLFWIFLPFAFYYLIKILIK